jgi:hypothetical protein
MVAMLEDAIQCYISPAGRMRADADNWIRSPSRRPVFSFCVVCETLGLDPDAVRAAVQRLPRSESARRRALPRSRPNARSSCRSGATGSARVTIDEPIAVNGGKVHAAKMRSLNR